MIKLTVSFEDYKERLGRLMAYRNRILSKVIHEVEKEFPNMDALSEEIARLVDAIDEFDDEVLAVLGEISDYLEKTLRTENSEEVEEEPEIPDFESWFVSTLNSLNGSDSMKNYLIILKQMNGVALSGKIVKVLGLKRSTVTDVEKELEKRGIIKTLHIGQTKVVYFNHPDFTNLRAEDLVKMIE